MLALIIRLVSSSYTVNTVNKGTRYQCLVKNERMFRGWTLHLEPLSVSGHDLNASVSKIIGLLTQR